MNSEKLPIEGIRKEFESLFSKGGPIVVTAPTGSGKSTQLPQWMAQLADRPILVIEPRRVACRSLATYLATQFGQPLGKDVGYRVRFSDESSDETKLLFVTPGVALRIIQQKQFPFAAVLVDEFHERGWECDLFVTLLRQRSKEVQAIPYVITSATIDGGKLAQSLNGDYLQAAGRLFPVNILYGEECSVPTTHRLDERVANAVIEVAEKDNGDILVFLPGKREIEKCSAYLSKMQLDSMELYKIHGSMPVEYLSKALSQHEGNRRIYLSTNVAETSLTVPQVTAVIDSGLVRMRRHRSGRSGLVLEPIAKSSMDQRAGRAGRVKAGSCIRLWSKAFRPLATTPPAVERVELDDCLLRAAACGLAANEWHNAQWPSSPPEFAITNAWNRLKKLEAINKDGTITSFGLKLLEMPLSVHQARLLVEPEKTLCGTLADILALLQSRGRLMLNLDGLSASRCDEVKTAREQLLEGATNEVIAELRCLRRGKVKTHHLHSSGLIEARRIATSLRQLLQCEVEDPVKDESKLPPSTELAKHILNRWPEGGFVLRKRAAHLRKKMKIEGRRPSKGEPWGNGRLELHLLPYPRWDLEGKHLPTAGIILEHEWVSGKGNELRGLGRFLLPCSRQELAKAGCGERKIIEPKFTDGKIVAVVEQNLAGVTLATEECLLEGELLRAALAEMFINGDWLPKGSNKIKDVFHYANMICNWPGGFSKKRDYDFKSLALDNPEAFVKERLATLGVVNAEDVELIDENDFSLDLCELLDLEPGELQALKDDFPRQWSYHGGVFDCHVNVREKIVDLKPADEKAKSVRDIPRLVIPPLRGFKVRLVKGSQVKTVRS